MNKLFDTLRHNRRLAMVVTLAGTLLFTFASAARAASGGNGWEAALAAVLMLLGVVAQFMGLLALMKKPRR
jgi:type IV secretory pathway VirB2 component (pilin)